MHEWPQKLSLLVAPLQFPDGENQIQGIFIKDYIEATKPYCVISVLAFYFSSTRTGLFIEDCNGYRVFRLYIRRGTGFFKWFSYIEMFVKMYMILSRKFKDVNIIHCHGSTLPGIITAYFAKKNGIRHFITEHVGPFSKISDNWIYYRLCKFSMENSHCVLPVSKHLENQILKVGILPKRTLVLYNPVNTNLFALKDKFGGNKVILYVGRLESYKGCMRTLMAFHQVTASIPGWTLRIIGDGPEKKILSDYIINNGLCSVAELLGYKSKAEIADEMTRSSVFVFPSEHETFGLVVAEAMSSGLPVITSATTVFPEYVDETDGILVNPLDIQELSNAILKIAQNLAFYRPEISRAKIVDRFSLETFGRRLFDLYSE